MKDFKFELRVQFFDTDKMQVVHHANYIRYFETARTEYLREVGFPYSEMEKHDFQMPVLGVNAKFKSSAFYDDVLLVSCRISKVAHASMEMEYVIINKETGQVLVTGNSKHGFTNRALRPVALKKHDPEIYEMFKALYEAGKK